MFKETRVNLPQFEVVFVHFEKALAMQVVRMDESLRNNLDFTAPNDVRVISTRNSSIDRYGFCLFLRGEAVNRDLNVSVVHFDSDKEVKEAVEKYEDALEELSVHLLSKSEKAESVAGFEALDDIPDGPKRSKLRR